MRKSLLFFVVAILAASSQVFAQPPAEMGPPKAMLIIREEIKPGMMGSHARHSAEFVNIFNQLQTPNHRIALVPIAGNENEVAYLNPVLLFGARRCKQGDRQKIGSGEWQHESKLDALDKEAPAMHAAMRDMLAVYRPELSFNPGVNIAQMRYFMVTTTRIRPGYEGAYVEYVAKLISMARQKAKVDNLHVATYMVISGAPGARS